MRPSVPRQLAPSAYPPEKKEVSLQSGDDPFLGDLMLY